MRAILKATDLCATDPARVARQIVDGGFTPRYDYAAQALGELPYDKWREYDPEDTVQIEPAKDHRRRHRLAFLERAQTRAEGVNINRKDFRCPLYRTDGSF
jgi:hypothetical protein